MVCVSVTKRHEHIALLARRLLACAASSRPVDVFLPNTLTTESLMDGCSEIRKRVIARVFKELGYIEQWGSGIARIKGACEARGLAEPRIREKGDFVDVEFYRGCRIVIK
jgi:hypothetical protein